MVDYRYLTYIILYLAPWTVICPRIHTYTTMLQLVVWFGGRGGDLCESFIMIPQSKIFVCLPVVNISCDFTLHTEYVCKLTTGNW